MDDDTGTRPRPAAERRRDTLRRLAAERDIWVATAHPERGPLQLPLWFLWDGQSVWLCTGARSLTVRNLRADPRVRLALPDTFDVVTLQGEATCFPGEEVSGEGGGAPGVTDAADAADAFAAKFGWEPRREEAPYVYVRVAPTTVRAWRGVPELSGRVIMRDGIWRDGSAEPIEPAESAAKALDR